MHRGSARALTRLVTDQRTKSSHTPDLNPTAPSGMDEPDHTGRNGMRELILVAYLGTKGYSLSSSPEHSRGGTTLYRGGGSHGLAEPAPRWTHPYEI
jgi:hypothetical protein